jgi:hypothetical protein
MDDYEAQLTAKLSHEGMTRTLIRAGALLSAYELIKLQIVDGVSDFYWSGRMNGDKKEYYPDYQTDVVDRDKSLYRASAAWLVESDALTPEDAVVLEKIHEHRNEIAHELPKILIDPDFDVNASLLVDATIVLRRLDVFWGRMSMDIDHARSEDIEVADKDIWEGPSLLMVSLMKIAGLLPDDTTAQVG